MLQNYKYFNRRDVTKRSCGCTLMFHFDNVSMSSTVPIVHKTLKGNLSKRHVIFFFVFVCIQFSCDRITGDVFSHLPSPLSTRGGRKVRVIDLPIPIRSSDCIGGYNRLMSSSDFCIGRLCRSILSSDSFINRSCFLVLSSDFCMGDCVSMF